MAPRANKKSSMMSSDTNNKSSTNTDKKDDDARSVWSLESNLNDKLKIKKTRKGGF